MSTFVRNSVLSILALLVVGYLIWAGIWASKHPQQNVCVGLNVLITDSASRQWVCAQDIEQWIAAAKLVPTGKDMGQVRCDLIEECVKKHPMLRTVECYTKNDYTVWVDVTQRIPKLRVVASDGSYFVDSDCKIMPMTAKVNDPMIVLRGNVSTQRAKGEYFDMAMWLESNPYWKNRITAIEVQSPKHVLLHQKDWSAVILLGDINGFEGKMNKLQKLYTKGFDAIGYKDYRELDLRFRGQVVAR